jgi:hypothetical protein
MDTPDTVYKRFSTMREFIKDRKVNMRNKTEMLHMWSELELQGHGFICIFGDYKTQRWKLRWVSKLILDCDFDEDLDGSSE